MTAYLVRDSSGAPDASATSMNSKDRPPTTSFISNGEKLLTKVAKKLLTNVTKVRLAGCPLKDAGCDQALPQHCEHLEAADLLPTGVLA